MTAAPQNTYRADVDGLRAVAVVPVLFYHAGFAWCAGGFVGVDVFFVISGYLITSILLADLGQDRYSLLSFYERRARRILPALIAILVFCLVAGYAVLPPYLYAETARSVVSVLFFASNLWFWHESGYFEEPTELNPLIHTWSLGVEEQFYLCFPLLLAFLFRRGPRFSGLVIAAIAAVSLIAAEVASYRWPSANFYLLPFRAWELALGCLLALYANSRAYRPPGRVAAEAAGLLGLAAIVVAVLTFDAETRFPGLSALLPAGGTAALIWSGMRSTWISRCLSLRPLVATGLISYSLYLWHQPLMAFARLISIEPPGAGVMLALIAVSFLLAYLSWRYVEQPFRNRAAMSRTRVFRWSAAASVAVLVCTLGVLLTDGMRARISGHAYAELMAFDRDQVREETWEPVQASPSDPDASSLAVVGDSHAKDVFNALAAAGCAPRDSIPLITLEQCEDLAPQSERYGRCANAFEFPLAPVEEAEHVILAPSWSRRQLYALPEVLERLKAKGVDVLVMNRTPAFDDVPLVAQRLAWRGDRGWDDLESAIASTRSQNPIRINRILGRLTDRAGVPLADRFAAVCPEDGCDLFGPRGEPYLYDRSHWTLAGARDFGQRLCRDPAIAAFLARAGMARDGMARSVARYGG